MKNWTNLCGTGIRKTSSWTLTLILIGGGSAAGIAGGWNEYIKSISACPVFWSSNLRRTSAA